MMAKPKSLAFPFFIALTVALAVVVYQFTMPRGGEPSASALAQTAPIPKDTPREPQAGETQVDGWLSVLYGDPALAFGVADASIPSADGTRIVALVDDTGTPLIDVAMPEGLINEYYGEYVRVIGTLRADTAALESRDQSRSAQSETILNARAVFPSPSPTRGIELPDARLVSGSQNWINLLCKFSDKPATPNVPSFYQSLFSTTEPGLDHYWQQISYGNINLTGTETVPAWKVLPFPRSHYVGTSADLNALRQDCTAIHDVDVFFPDFVGVNMFFNDNLDCCAWGGGASMSLDGQTKFYRTTYLPTWAVNHGVIAHEMGHGYGFPHSTGPANNPPSGLSVYVSEWDVMSDSQGTCAVSSPSYQCIGPGTITYHLNLAEWIPPERIVTVDTGQDMTITLERTVLPQSSDNPLMAIVPIGSSSTIFYTVEARNIGAGYDQNIPASAVIIHDVNTTRTGNGGHAYVVDADTNNTNTNDAGSQWLPGETYNDVARGVSIQVLSQSGSTYTVRIINNSVTPTTPPPPANDLFANARPVSTGTSYTQEWYGATDSFTDPSPSCAPFAGTVWYKFTPSLSGSITIDTIGSSSSTGGLVDTVLAVYTGTEGSLTERACNDDIVTGVNVVSRATFNVTAGAQYYVVVGSYGNTPIGASSTLFLSLSGVTGSNTATATSSPTRTATSTPTRTATSTPTMTATYPAGLDYCDHVWLNQEIEFFQSSVHLYIQNDNPFPVSIQRVTLNWMTDPDYSSLSPGTIYHWDNTTNTILWSHSGVDSPPTVIGAAPSEFAFDSGANRLIPASGESDLSVGFINGPGSYIFPTLVAESLQGTTITLFYNGIECDLVLADPMATNLINNGTFDSWDDLLNMPSGWGLYGEPFYPVYRVENGVFEFYRQPGSTQGVILTNMNRGMPVGTLLDAHFELGNTSPTRKRMTVLMHDNDFSDLFACTFWLPPNMPLTPYRMTGRPTEDWQFGEISFYSSTVGDDGYTQLDNVYVTAILDDGSNAVMCYDPFAP